MDQRQQIAAGLRSGKRPHKTFQVEEAMPATESQDSTSEHASDVDEKNPARHFRLKLKWPDSKAQDGHQVRGLSIRKSRRNLTRKPKGKRKKN